MRTVLLLLIAGCAHDAAPTGVTLRPACGDGQYWDGSACKQAGDAPAKLAAGKQALDELKVDEAKVALDAAEKAGPLDHEHHIALWEQRGIAAAYVDDDAGAQTAFDMLLALDPGHFLSYTLSPKATFVFEKVRARKDRVAPELDVTWDHGHRVGEVVPLSIEVLNDPKQFLKRATLFVRTHGDAKWEATDVTLKPGEQRVVLPPVEAKKSLSLDVYLRAYDDKGNEVLAWADRGRPREIPLRYDPPKPWYLKWWGLTAIGLAVTSIVGVTVYETTLAPPDKIMGSATVK
jgi:hypothetical protein